MSKYAKKFCVYSYIINLLSSHKIIPINHYALYRFNIKIISIGSHNFLLNINYAISN